MSSIPLTLRRENGKKITVEFNGETVALIVWSKSGTPKLPLELTVEESKALRLLLDNAISKAAGAVTADQFMSATTATRTQILRAAKSTT